VRDVLEILGRRWPAAEVWLRPTRVQGDGAAEDIAAAVALFNRVAGPASERPLDVIILGRGGGSLEDLWPFNEEIVARALYASIIPTVSGVGHEDDYTIADMVADVRALTPSEAAERVVPDRAKVQDWLDTVDKRCGAALRRRLGQARDRLEELADRRCFRLPLERVRDEERRLDELCERLSRAARQCVSQARQKADAATARLESLSPLNVLARGYSLSRREQDQVLVRAADQVRPGERVVTVLRSGQFFSRVEEVRADGPVA
jgi:exodeoxyribonuclease VII large subunit